MACMGVKRFRKWEAPIRARLIAPDFPNSISKTIVPKIDNIIPEGAANRRKNQQGYVNFYKFINGSELELMSYEQPVLKHASIDLDLVAFDEPPPQSLFNENTTRLIDRNGCCILALTPIKEDGGYPIGWLYDEIYEKSTTPEFKDIYFWIEADIEENKASNGGHLPDEAVDQKLKEWNKDEATFHARKSGKFTHLLGLVFKGLDREVHLCEDPIDVSDDNKWTRFSATDPHPRNPIATLYMAVNRMGDLVVYDEIYLDGITIKDYCAEMKKHEQLYGVPRFRFMDESADADNQLTNLNVMREFKKYGIHCRGANNKLKYSIGILKMREALQKNFNNLTGKETSRLKILRRCVNFWYQLTHYVYDEHATARSRDKQNPKEKPRKKDDHLVDDALYIMSNNPHYVTPYKTQEEDWDGGSKGFEKTGYRSQ